MTTLIEARCKRCPKTHLIKADDGTPTETAYCPPSSAHRKWEAMRPGEVQVTERKVLNART